jgi:hypothetical protein
VLRLTALTKLTLYHYTFNVTLQAPPKVVIGAHCTKPYTCQLKELAGDKGLCWAHVPVDSPFSLYRLGKEKAFRLLADLSKRGGSGSGSGNGVDKKFDNALDIAHVRDADIETFKLNAKMQIQLVARRDGRPHVRSATNCTRVTSFCVAPYTCNVTLITSALPLLPNTLTRNCNAPSTYNTM